MVKEFFKQADQTSCGVAAINSVLKMHNKNGVVFSSPKGTTPQKMIKILEAQGVSATPKKRVAVSGIKPKSILYYPGEDHYVAIKKVGANKAFVNDSLKNKGQWINLNTLKKKWKGWAIETRKKV